MMVIFPLTAQPKADTATKKISNNAQTYKIEYENGKTFVFNHGQYVSEHPNNFGETTYLTNEKNGKGRLIGNIGSTEVVVIEDGNIVHFIEITGININTITIDKDQWIDEKQAYHCTYQRMIKLGTGRALSTYWGYATPWN
jgi:hypothetical protein